MSKAQISIVSLTWNSSRFIEPMLTSLLEDADTSNVPIEAIFLDNGSTDDSVRLLRSFQERDQRVQVVPLSKNLGTTVPRNIGIRMARGENILILDSDTVIPPGALAGLLDGLDKLGPRHEIGMLCPKLIYPNGDFQESARRFPTVLTKFYRLLHLESLRERDETVAEVLAQQITQADYAISAAWFVPATTFQRVGYLDEEIFYAPEDVEFCARVWRHGLKVWYYPTVEIIHDCQRITNRKPFSKLGVSHALGLMHYWKKHGAFLRRASRRE